MMENWESLVHLVQPGDEGALDFFPPVRILDCFEAAITIDRHRESLASCNHITSTCLTFIYSNTPVLRWDNL